MHPFLKNNIITKNLPNYLVVRDFLFIFAVVFLVVYRAQIQVGLQLAVGIMYKWLYAKVTMIDDFGVIV